MKNINDVWNVFKLLITILWIIFTFHAIILSFEGHLLTLNIVLGIDIIIGIYYIFIKKN